MKLSSAVLIILANQKWMYIWTFVLQGSAVTYLRQGGRYYSVFFCSSSQECNSERIIKNGQSIVWFTVLIISVLHCLLCNHVSEETDTIVSLQHVVNMTFSRYDAILTKNLPLLKAFAYEFLY